MDSFLASVEKKAYKMALIATGDRDEALDIVQDAMMKWVQAYSDRPESQWKPLFYRILNNRIMDGHRRNKVRRLIGRWRDWFHSNDETETEAGPDQFAGATPEPSRQLESEQAIDRLDATVRKLPRRQQQAFFLRALEGMDVAQTAQAMGCSEGSVKTHYSRAMQQLRTQLEGYL